MLKRLVDTKVVAEQDVCHDSVLDIGRQVGHSCQLSPYVAGRPPPKQTIAQTDTGAK